MNYLVIMVTSHVKVFGIGNKREDSCAIREVNVTQSEMLQPEGFCQCREENSFMESEAALGIVHGWFSGKMSVGP